MRFSAYNSVKNLREKLTEVVLPDVISHQICTPAREPLKSCEEWGSYVRMPVLEENDGLRSDALVQELDGVEEENRAR
jgi:hypothetical protein